MSRRFIFAIVLGWLLCWSPRAGAIDRTWDHEAANDLWISASNWDPDGVPEFNDDVYIGANGSTADDTVLLTSFGGQLTATVRNLRINRGTDLDTDGNILQVRQDTLVEGVIAGQTPSELIVRSAGRGVLAFDTNTLTIANGGRLRMSGSNISVDGTGDVDGVLKVREGGSIYGYGMINLDDDNIPDFVDMLLNDGTITVGDPDALVIGEPPGVTLQINAPNDPQMGLMDIDGDGDDGQVVILRNSTLELNVRQISGSSAGDMTMYGNSALDLGVSFGVGNASLDDTATLYVNSGETDGVISLPAAPAVITGETFVLAPRGRIWLSQSDAELRIESEFLALNGSIINNGTIHFASDARIEPAVTFSGDGEIVNDFGGTLQLPDGVNADTDLANDGVLAIHSSLAGNVLIDSFEQTSNGMLEMQIGDILPGDFDVLTVEGNAFLSGTLAVELINAFEPILGNSFTVLETVFGNISGEFDVEQVPTFDDLTFDVLYNPQSVVLQVVEALPGDYNQNGTVDAADYTVWRDNLGSANALPNDDTPGVGPDDYTRWKTNFGQSAAGGGSSVSVPEPAGATLLVAAILAIRAGNRRQRH